MGIKSMLVKAGIVTAGLVGSVSAAVSETYTASDIPTLLFNLIGGIFSGLASATYAAMLGVAIMLYLVMTYYGRISNWVFSFIKRLGK